MQYQVYQEEQCLQWKSQHLDFGRMARRTGNLIQGSLGIHLQFSSRAPNDLSHKYGAKCFRLKRFAWFVESNIWCQNVVCTIVCVVEHSLVRHLYPLVFHCFFLETFFFKTMQVQSDDARKRYFFHLNEKNFQFFFANFRALQFRQLAENHQSLDAMCDKSKDAGFCFQLKHLSFSPVFTAAFKEKLLKIFLKKEWGKYGLDAAKAIQGVPEGDDKKYFFLLRINFFANLSSGWWQ